MIDQFPFLVFDRQFFDQAQFFMVGDRGYMKGIPDIKFPVLVLDIDFFCRDPNKRSSVKFPANADIKTGSLKGI